MDNDKHIQFESIDCDFSSIKEYEPIALDFIHVIEKLSIKIAPHLATLNLPKEISIVFIEDSFGPEIAGKWKDFDIIHISTTRLRELEESCNKRAEAYGRP
jgi:hypothetical protein